DPWRATEALGSLGTKKAIESLIGAIPSIEKPEIRSEARIRVARSSYDGAVDYLLDCLKDRSLSDSERMVATECLGLVAGDGEGLRQAMKIALGPPQPVGALGERDADYPVRDIRAAAVVAVMKRGDQDCVRRLIDVADEIGADPAFTRMVDSY